MKRFLFLSLVVLSFTFNVFSDTVPSNPSIVTVNGYLLEVQHRRWDNTLKAKENYVSKDEDLFKAKTDKIVLGFLMIFGRLEIIAIIYIFVPKLS